jgi:hypothetical protein
LAKFKQTQLGHHFFWITLHFPFLGTAYRAGINHIKNEGSNMAKNRKYKVEKTKVGLQYVIPGAESITRVAIPSMQYATDGAQLVIPGAEQISIRELVSRIMAQPIRPVRRQRGLAGMELFGG